MTRRLGNANGWLLLRPVLSRLTTVILPLAGYPSDDALIQSCGMRGASPRAPFAGVIGSWTIRLRQALLALLRMMLALMMSAQRGDAEQAAWHRAALHRRGIVSSTKRAAREA
jgi:hypothetical protein